MYKSNRIESSNQSSNLFHTYIHVSQHVSHKYVCQLAVFRKKKVDCHVFYTCIDIKMVVVGGSQSYVRFLLLVQD